MTTEVVGNCGWTYAPVSERSRERSIEGRLRTFAYDGPVEWESFADHLGVLSQDVGHSQNLAWFVGHNTIRYAAGVFGPQATEEQLARMEGYVAEAMHAGALGLSTGLEFKPGREAPTDEIVRLNKVVGRYGGHYTSHMRNRDSSLQDSIDEFLRIIREGGTKGEISHLNVRNRTGRRAGRLAARGRHDAGRPRVEGLDVLADTTPFRDGLGADGRDPAAVGARRRLGGGAASGCATRWCASGCRTSATATGASSTGATGTASASRRARSTRASRARSFPEIARAARQERVGVLLRHPRRRPAPRSTASC